MSALWPGDQLNFSIFIKPTFVFAGQRAASEAGHIANTNVIAHFKTELSKIENMLKKILIGLGIVVGLVVLTGAFGVYYFLPNEDKVLNFIKTNPEKSSILLVRNDTIFASRNIDKVMPLASTVKIILAIEYAEQSANGQINPDELIPLSELDKFYVPNTDGGAHPSWLKSIKDKISDDKISIREIAKGMIKFSSNANTEWLLFGVKFKSMFHNVVRSR